MANIKINQLPAGTLPLTGAEILPVDQGANTVKITVDDVVDYVYENGPTLDQVLDAGDISTTSLTIGSTLTTPSEYTTINAGIIDMYSTVSDSNTQYKANGINVYSLDGFSDMNIYYNTNNQTIDYPTESGTLALKVNGVPADSSGNIPINVVNTIKVSLTSANIIGATFLNPFTLIPAQGIGKYIDVLSITAVCNNESTPYNSTARLVFRLGASGSVAAPILGQIENFLNNSFVIAAKIQTAFQSNIGGIGGVLANQPLIFDTGANAAVGGNKTVDIYISYSVITI